MLVLPPEHPPDRLVAHVIGQGQAEQALMPHPLGQLRTEGRGKAGPLVGRGRRDGEVVGGVPSAGL